MERKTSSTGEFEEAIKNFSKASVKVDALLNAGRVDAYKLMNKSIEHRNEAIANEVTKRLKSFEMVAEGAKSKELFLEEVQMEFDKGVEEQKIRLRGDDSAIDVSKAVENKKSENVDDDDSNDGSEDSKDSSEENESDEDSDDTDSSNDDDNDDEDSSGSGDDDDDENTEEEGDG